LTVVIDFQYVFPIGYSQLFDYQHSSKCLLCSTEGKVKQGWEKIG